MIIFLYGEDKFRLNEKLNQLKDDFFKKNTSNATSSVFDFSEGNFWPELKIALKSRGLFSQSFIVIIKNFLAQNSPETKEEIIKFFADNFAYLDRAENLIVFWENSAPKKNDKIFKWLGENAKSEEFGKLSTIQLKKWIEKKISSSTVNIDSKIINDLINNKNGNLFAINKEIEKIINFVGRDGRLDEKLNSQIAKLINSDIEANIFQTIEQIASGNKRKALEMLHQQWGQGSDPFYILSMYVYQVRNLLKIADFYFKGNTNYGEVSKIVKLHPFVVQKAMHQLRGLDFRKLKDIYRKLEEIEENAKRGKMSVEAGLDLLIAEM